MRRIAILLLLVCFSCGDQDPEAHIPYLSGYWEIEKVTFEDGTEKNYQINTVIDYIEIQGDSGVRKKLAPRLDGTFKATNASEQFYLKTDNNNLQLHYKTPYAQWTETVLKTGDSLLKIRNEDGKIYTYKRFTPITIE